MTFHPNQDLKDFRAVPRWRYIVRDMKNLGHRPPETLTDALLALACAAGAVVLWLALGAALI